MLRHVSRKAEIQLLGGRWTMQKIEIRILSSVYEVFVFYATSMLYQYWTYLSLLPLGGNMPSTTEKNLKELLEELPPFLNAPNLVQIGLYPSKISVYKALERGEAPPFFYISKRKIRFPKNELIGWLKERAEKNSKSYGANTRVIE